MDGIDNDEKAVRTAHYTVAVYVQSGKGYKHR